MLAVVQQLLVITTMAVILHKGCCSGVGSVDVLGTVLAASVESDSVIPIHLSQLLLVQWCHNPAMCLAVSWAGVLAVSPLKLVQSNFLDLICQSFTSRNKKGCIS